MSADVITPRRACPSCRGIGKVTGTSHGRPARIRCTTCSGWGTIPKDLAAFTAEKREPRQFGWSK